MPSKASLMLRSARRARLEARTAAAHQFPHGLRSVTVTGVIERRRSPEIGVKIQPTREFAADSLQIAQSANFDAISNCKSDGDGRAKRGAQSSHALRGIVG